MKKRLRDIREQERDESLLTYGRPSVSAWIAAAAVAFAFFILGGFIKTYRQLEILREETQQEISELRETVRRFREDRLVMAHSPQARGGYQQQSRIQSLPPARRDQYESNRQFPSPVVPDDMAAGMRQGGLRPEMQGRQSLRPADPGFLDDFNEQPAIERPRYQLGRTFEGGENRLLGSGGGPCQVISVSSDRKRLIVEGGRDLGLSEGTRLELCRDGRWAADLRVLDVYDSQSAAEVLHATISPQPGDTIRRAPQSR